MNRRTIFSRPKKAAESAPEPGKSGGGETSESKVSWSYRVWAQEIYGIDLWGLGLLDGQHYAVERPHQVIHLMNGRQTLHRFAVPYWAEQWLEVLEAVQRAKPMELPATDGLYLAEETPASCRLRPIPRPGELLKALSK